MLMSMKVRAFTIPIGQWYLCRAERYWRIRLTMVQFHGKSLTQGP